MIDLDCVAVAIAAAGERDDAVACCVDRRAPRSCDIDTCMHLPNAVDRVDTMTVTGGEPSLGRKRCRQCLEHLLAGGQVLVDLADIVTLAVDAGIEHECVGACCRKLRADRAAKRKHLVGKLHRLAALDRKRDAEGHRVVDAGKPFEHRVELDGDLGHRCCKYAERAGWIVGVDTCLGVGKAGKMYGKEQGGDTKYRKEGMVERSLHSVGSRLSEEGKVDRWRWGSPGSNVGAERLP